MKVSSKSNCSSVAGAISQQLREGKQVEVQVIGAGALNQAMKGIIIAKGHLAPLGFEIVCRPSFVDLEIEGKERTGIRMALENRVPQAQPEEQNAEKKRRKQ